MESSSSKRAFMILTLVLGSCAQAALGAIACGHLDESNCAFAVSSSGDRCVLEKRAGGGRREEEYICRESGIQAAAGVRDWVETDGCVEACGLDRKTLGISSDSLLDLRFAQKLCSPACYNGCPNVVDLYFNLAAGEGVFLPDFCHAGTTRTRRATSEIRSSGFFASAPGKAVNLHALAPTQPPL